MNEEDINDEDLMDYLVEDNDELLACLACGHIFILDYSQDFQECPVCGSWNVTTDTEDTIHPLDFKD